MPIDRVFLGWDGPCLHKAARWLLERHATADAWDLGDVVVVTPGSRAGRRLLEVLVETAQRRVLTPPTILTPGVLPERFYASHARVADDLHARLARLHALRHAEGSLIRGLVHAPPDAEDVTGWWRLADELHTLHDTLAGELITHRDVPKRCGAAMAPSEEERWDVLAALHELYEATLAAQGMIDRHAARAKAVNQNWCATPLHIVLLATTDLNTLTRRMLDQVCVAAKVTALIHAPSEEAEGFDEYGCLSAGYWSARRVALDMQRVHVADRPRDQAHEALRVMEAYGGRFAADQITLGLGDEAIAPTLDRALGLAGVPVRSAVGAEVTQTSPVLFLRAMSDFLRSGRFDDFATLLRHPDVENHLRRVIGPKEASGQWLTLMDRYLTDHLQVKPVKQWLGKQATELKKVWDTVVQLSQSSPPMEGGARQPERRPFSHWSPVIAGMLTTLYGDRTLDRHAPGDAPLFYALDAIAAALREQAALEPEVKTTPRVDLPTAIALTFSRLTGVVVPDQRHGAAVEMLGWLELQLDDAPALIVTGVNEGNIPQSVHAHVFLPNHVRSILGMLDNARRYARDAMALQAILASRDSVDLITGRRTADGDPLTPSRLLLACDERELAGRVNTLLHPGVKPEPLLLTPGGVSRFVVPPPVPPTPPITQLSVTAFRAYLACPYRFYLSHVLKLEPLDDRAVELDALAFGNLAHDVLYAMATQGVASSPDPDVIAKFLAATLHEQTRIRYGAGAPAAVMIQQKLLEERFRAFSEWQAKQVREGWTLLGTERGMSATLEVDGEPFQIVGRVDRIDRHANGAIRIADYKTSDTAKKPKTTHRSQEQWIDLQLPLYLELARGNGLISGSKSAVELGYIQLPKKTKGVGFDAAEWTAEELEQALEVACDVIRGVRAGVFWPPTYPPEFGEVYSGICQDEALDRAEALAEGDRLARERGGRR